MHQRAIFKHRYRVVLGSTEIRHVEMTGLCTPAPVGLAMVGVVRDVSEELRRAEALSQGRADEAAARTRSKLLLRLSHELRAPLNAVLGLAQLLRAQTGDLSPRHGAWVWKN